jgi:hypothetical protein
MSGRLGWLLVLPLLASASLLGGLIQPEAPGSQTAKSLSAADQRKLERVVTEIREAILNSNVKALLRHFSRTEPLVCTDTGYSYNDVQRFLEQKDSHLYMSLFNSARFAPSCGQDYPSEYPAISDKDFLASASPEATVISLGTGWAKVSLTSAVKGHFAREWYFHREAGTWKLAGGSFILGRCSCG